MYVHANFDLEHSFDTVIVEEKVVMMCLVFLLLVDTHWDARQREPLAVLPALEFQSPIHNNTTIALTGQHMAARHSRIPLRLYQTK